MEMVAAVVHQLTRNLSDQQIQDSAFAPYFVDHTTAVYPTAASGFPWSAASIQSTGDPIADLTEDLAADGAMVKEQFVPLTGYSYTRSACPELFFSVKAIDFTSLLCQLKQKLFG